MQTKIEKPYYRIIRIDKNNSPCDYVLDDRYALDRQILIRSYHTLEKDMIRLFEYIEPTEENFKAYSVRTYEILLRAATEFETNAKAILTANGYQSEFWTIQDYYKINIATRLSDYKIKIASWTPWPKVFQPLQDWSTGFLLFWYQDYNNVKHDRAIKFPLATFRNAVNAVAAVFCILFAQFGIQVFNAHNEQFDVDESDGDGFLFLHDSLFSIKPYDGWKDNELYDLKNILLDEWRKKQEPFQKFTFDNA